MSLLTIVNNVNRLCPGLNPDVVKSFIQDSYLQLSRREWNMLRVIRTVSTMTPYGTGTVSVNALGVVTIVGGVFTAAMDQCWMRLYYSDSLFWIGSVTPPASLALMDWPGNVLVAQSYTIYKSMYMIPYFASMPMTLITDVVYQTSLPKKSSAYFNVIDPSRLSTGTPLYWADVGIDDYRQPIIEIFPLPDKVYPLRIYGRVRAEVLDNSDSPVLPEDLIEAHVLVALFRLQDSLHPKQGWAERLGEQQGVYQDILDQAMDEDYQRGSHSDKVKDVTEWPYPPDDSFRASHDVD